MEHLNLKNETPIHQKHLFLLSYFDVEELCIIIVFIWYLVLKSYYFNI